jgi:hypothetical protein
MLLERIKTLDVTQVWLQAFADPGGSNVAAAVYFPNRHLPMRADLFSRVAWQLRTRCGVEVYAWLPVLAWQLPDAAMQAGYRYSPGPARKPRPQYGSIPSCLKLALWSEISMKTSRARRLSPACCLTTTRSCATQMIWVRTLPSGT